MRISKSLFAIFLACLLGISLTFSSPTLAQKSGSTEALASKGTALELKRELSQLDKDIPALRSRDSSLKDLASRLSTADKRIAEIKLEALANALSSLSKSIDEYMKEFEKKGPLPQKKSIKEAEDISSKWRSLQENIAAVDNELDQIVSAISQASDAVRLAPGTISEFGFGFIQELHEPILNEVILMRQAHFELKQYYRDDLAFSNFRKKSVPLLIKKVPALKATLTDSIAKLRAKVDAEMSDNMQSLKNKEERQKALVKELGQREEGSQKTDAALLTFALPSFGILLFGLLVVPKYYAPAVQLSIFQSGLLLELTTVFLLTTSILLLGIAEKLNSEVLGTLIGGISGYVLGRWRKIDSGTEQQNKHKPPNS